MHWINNMLWLYLQRQVWHLQLGTSWNLHLAKRNRAQSHHICPPRTLDGSNIDQSKNMNCSLSQPCHSCMRYSQDFEMLSHSIPPTVWMNKWNFNENCNMNNDTSRLLILINIELSMIIDRLVYNVHVCFMHAVLRWLRP